MSALLKTKEAAAFLNVSPVKLRELVRAKLVPCVKISEKILRFRRESLVEWMARKERA